MSSTAISRLIDAALNRAGEGLRVVEDYVRFVRDDRHLTSLAKALRHDLQSIATTLDSRERHAARNTQADVGTGIDAVDEFQRHDPWDVCAASFKRVQQSLRSLEEYGKLRAPKLGAELETLRYRVYTLEKVTDIARDSEARLADVRLMVLIDGGLSADDFEQFVTTLVAADVGAIQLRDKRLNDLQLMKRARLLRQITQGSPTLEIINDRPDIAALVDADGVHVGQDDLPVKDVRSMVGPRMLVGVSTHSIEQARTAVLDGANYLGAGPTFPSVTKRFDSYPGLAYLEQVATEIRLPTFAIGGLDDDNVQLVRKAGIDRVAVSGAVTGALDPAAAARAILDALQQDMVRR